MKTITLTKGYVALVDDEDYELVNQFKWCVRVVSPTLRYAMRSKVTRVGKKFVNKTILMHRFVLKLNPASPHVDHKDRDGLNNQKNNLRFCTNRQNHYNVPKVTVINTSSKYKGVYKSKHLYRQSIPWNARIRVNGARPFLGSFALEEEAARAYNEAAKKYFGEFALLNEIAA